MPVRGLILFSTLTISVLFRFWRDDAGGQIGFPFSPVKIGAQWWIYFAMEHIIAIGYAACLVIQDDTPKVLLWTFFAIMCADFVHFLLFYRDPGVGFNLVKVIIFIIAMIWSQRNYFRR